jgi:hypothetical protein
MIFCALTPNYASANHLPLPYTTTTAVEMAVPVLEIMDRGSISSERSQNSEWYLYHGQTFPFVRSYASLDMSAWTYVIKD